MNAIVAWLKVQVLDRVTDAAGLVVWYTFWGLAFLAAIGLIVGAVIGVLLIALEAIRALI